mgnify:CR=1 FL=1
MLRRLLHTIFFGNIFYGMAAVLLALETAAKLYLQPLPYQFYVLLGLGTIFFYTESYSFDPAPQPGNLRAGWIYRHKAVLMAGQWIMAIASIMLAAWLAWMYRAQTYS